MGSVRQTAVLVLFAVLAAFGAWYALPEPAPVEADGPPVRIVSLAPAITETIVWLGAEDRLVGRSDWCSKPDSVQSVPAIGSTMTPNWEALVATRPDHVFVEQNQSTPLTELQAIAPTTALPWLDVDQVVGSVRTLGTVLEVEDKAAELVTALRMTLDPRPPEDGPTVLLVMASADLGQGEVWFIRRNSLHGRVLEAAGAHNAVAQDITGPPSLSLEQLVALEMDAIVVLADGELSSEEEAKLAAAFTRLEPLAQVPVGVVSGPGLLITGPSILDLVQALRTELDTLLP